MEMLQTIRKTDLARNTSQVIRNVLRGQTAVVESHGQPEVAIVDIIDYQIQRAALNYYAQQPAVSEADDFSDRAFTAIRDDQERFNQVIAYYLAELISLGRMAELLGLPAFDLRLRFVRLGIPLRLGPRTIEEAQEEIKAAHEWEKKSL
jgi:predicted HTH domain antitoxin